MILIDADALRQRMHYEAFETDTDMQRWDSGCWIRYKLFENCLDSMPAISNAALRPVGKWIALEPEIGLYGCSRCEHMILRAECNYCPNCGAKMKGVEDKS